MTHIANPPNDLPAALKTQYHTEYHNKYDRLTKEAVMIHLRTTLIVAGILVGMAAWMTGGLTCAFGMDLNMGMQAFVHFISWIALPVAPILATVLGVYSDYRAYDLLDDRRRLKAVMNNEYNIKKTNALNAVRV